MSKNTLMGISPEQVHENLAQHMLVDGFGVVLDLNRSKGLRLFDSKSGKSYLDMFSCFASAPLGFNHDKMMEPEFVSQLGRVSITKPSNSDLYSVELAEFVDAFARLAAPAYLPHLFFVEGGALGVENALKTAMDWKVRKNMKAGRGELGGQVMHFKECFHGRTGYTLSLTNTDPVKTQYFTRFDWPRISNPKLSFPITAEVESRVAEAEVNAIREMELAFKNNEHDICAMILEPIQGEGGDNHFRPQFFKELRRLADEYEAFLIFDEVQSGLGITGKMWAHEHYGVQPDAIAFGKKVQVCGTAVGKRVAEVENHVFQASSRINSTWGGNLVDMVRCTRILEIMQEDRLVENAQTVGAHLLSSLETLAQNHAELISGARGRGLMCAFDAKDSETRDKIIGSALDKGLMVIGCGAHSIRFRPALQVSQAEIDEAVGILDESLKEL